MRELVIKLTPEMLKIDNNFITAPRVDRTISRIYRDVRFSKDHSLYRDNCWFVFMRDKKLYMGLPAFYFDMSPSGFSYGMGYYQASPASMASIREIILNRDESFTLALKAYQGQDIFVMYGDSYKKTRYPDEPEHLREWLDKKSVSFNHDSEDFDLLFSDKLANVMLEGYKTLAPIYDFLCDAEFRVNSAGV